MKAQITFIFLLFSLISTHLKAQNTVSEKMLTWFADGGKDRRSGQTFTDDWKIITNTNKSVALARGTDQTLEFDIESIEGTWMDEMQDGKLTYTVKYQANLIGKITIQRKNSVLSATVDFSQSNQDGLNFEYSITNVQ